MVRPKLFPTAPEPFGKHLGAAAHQELWLPVHPQPHEPQELIPTATGKLNLLGRGLTWVWIHFTEGEISHNSFHIYCFQPGAEHQKPLRYFLALHVVFLAPQEASGEQDQDLFLGDLQLPDIRVVSQI